MILLATRAVVDQSFKKRAISRQATEEEAMTKKNLIILAISTTLVLSVGTSAMATVTGILSDGCGGNSVCQPSFVSPVVAGKQMTVTVKGQYVDLSTGVEISGSGVCVSLDNRAHGNNSSVDVKFNVSASASPGERTVKLHYAVEMKGPDTFKVQVVHGGSVDQIQQRVAFLNSTRLIAPDSIQVNQKVTLVFTGHGIGNAAIAPVQAVKDVRTLPGCSETRCEFELEFTKTGNIDVHLFDGNLGATTADALAINGTLSHFFYGGATRVTVTGQATPSTNLPWLWRQPTASPSPCRPSAGSPFSSRCSTVTVPAFVRC